MWSLPLRVGLATSLVALSLLSEARSKDRKVAGMQKIVVAVFNRAGVPAKTVVRAEAIAAKIYEAAGLVIVWKNCSTEEEPNPKQCGAGNSQVEIVLSIEHQGQIGTADVYGVAFLGEDGRGKFCQVFYDRILELHNKGRASDETILGIVAAHELGHLLFGPGAHSDNGIMRAQIQSQNFLTPAFGFHLTPQQLQKIRERQQTISDVKEKQ